MSDGISNVCSSDLVTPPTVPQNLAATAAGHNRIDLSWNASSDTESGVAGYGIFRDGLAAGTTAGKNFAATRLVPTTARTEVSRGLTLMVSTGMIRGWPTHYKKKQRVEVTSS